MNKPLSDSIRYIKHHLLPLYGDKECDQFIYLIFEHLLNYSKIDIHLKQNEPVTEEIFQKVESITEELINFKPIQYILGKTFFYDLPFYVNEHVLIPRQETEELVHWIIKDQKDQTSVILDIGTGSGCIAVALAKYLRHCSISACDISDKALEVAGKNAQMNHLSVSFFLCDILSGIEDCKKFNAIVSNPPYVCESEKKTISRNVLDFEPHVALFVPDDDPLKYYREISSFALKNLAPGGSLYFEINENFGGKMVDLLRSFDFSNIELRKDINGKTRMIKAELKFNNK
jgi:release factor glutamine methyltransferase